MRISVDRELSREWPEEWMSLLRAISPVSAVHSYLMPRWLPARKVHQSGAVEDRGRWVLYEWIPRSGIPAGMVQMLADRPPRLLPKGQQYGRSMFVDDYTHEMYRLHGVWARPFLVLQGDDGGTPIAYPDVERELRRVKGLSTEPPKIGQLPYAPFDMRVVRQILHRDRLAKYGQSIDALKKSASSEVMRREAEQAERQFRSDYLAWMEEESLASADFLTSYSRTTESDRTLRPTSKSEETAAAILRDVYLETGEVPPSFAHC